LVSSFIKRQKALSKQHLAIRAEAAE